MTKVEIELPATILIRTIDGEAFNIETSKVPANVVAAAFVTGTKVLFTNVYNGGGKDASPAERKAAVEKKRDAWYRGEVNVTERGESQYSAFREVFIADCIAAGMTTKAAEEAIKTKVAERLGKDTKATFANFIEATAIEYAEADKSLTRDDARTALESYYASESDRRAKEREAAGSKVKLPTIDLSAFRKQEA